MKTRSLWISGLLTGVGMLLGACGPSSRTVTVPVPVSVQALPAAPTYLVTYRQNGVALDAITAAGGALVARYDQIGVAVVRSADPAFAARIRQDPRVEGASGTAAFAVKVRSGVAADPATTDRTLGALGVPDASLTSLQWDMEQIHAPQAQGVTPGSRAVLVGDLDTGLDYTHPDLAANVDFASSASCVSGAPDPTPAAWMDANGHGTHTAGTIAAADNGLGITGVAPGVRLAGVAVGNSDGFFFPEAVVCGFMWAANRGMDVTNNSYFADPWLFNCRNDPEQRAIWDAERRAIRYALARGVTVIAAAGNENMDLSKTNIDTISPDDTQFLTREVTNACAQVPAEVPGVITVSSVGRHQVKAFYSSYGVGTIAVTAPGGDSFDRGPDNTSASGRILSTFPAALATQVGASSRVQVCQNVTCGTYVYFQGTSMAAPHAAGVAALMISRFGRLSPAVVQARLGQTAQPLECPWRTFNPVPQLGPDYSSTCSGGMGHTSFYGSGEVDALAAVTR